MKINCLSYRKVTPLLPALLLIALSFNSPAQNTQVRGFLNQITVLKNEKLSFILGEPDLFVTSDLNDRFSILGEVAFKYDKQAPLFFNVSIERAIIKYNYYRNHNIVFGKHHTPVNYWNDTYHQGKVFYPSIWRPSMFVQRIVPLHTEGIGIQGHDLLGNLHFGYDFMIGNGLGSTDALDNDKYKSITAAIHIKPVTGLRIGASYYYDHISPGTQIDTMTLRHDVDERLYSATLAYFGPRFEFLAEGTIAQNHTDTLGASQTIAYYVYGGVRFLKKFTAYGRYDQLKFQNNEVYFNNNDQTAIIAGIRYQINYLAVVKMEYERQSSVMNGDLNILNAEIAVGF